MCNLQEYTYWKKRHWYSMFSVDGYISEGVYIDDLDFEDEYNACSPQERKDEIDKIRQKVEHEEEYEFMQEEMENREITENINTRLTTIVFDGLLNKLSCYAAKLLLIIINDCLACCELNITMPISDILEAIPDITKPEMYSALDELAVFDIISYDKDDECLEVVFTQKINDKYVF